MRIVSTGWGSVGYARGDTDAANPMPLGAVSLLTNIPATQR